MLRRIGLGAFLISISAGCSGGEGSEFEVGESSEAIVGGDLVSQAEMGNYPGIASLIGYGTLQIPDDHYCGAVLIAPGWLVTTAHCFNQFSAGNNLGLLCKQAVDADNHLNCEVDLGRADWRDSYSPERGAAEGVTFFRIQKIYPHAQYNSADPTFRNDIALIELQSKVPISTTRRAGLLKKKWIDRIIPLFEPTIAAGWGAYRARGDIRTPTLSRDTLLTVADNLSYFGDAATCIAESDWPIGTWQPSSTHLCAGNILAGDHDPGGAQTYDGRALLEVAQGVCKGDSGGPLYFDVPSAGRAVIGLTSASPGCALQGMPAWFTRVGDFVNAFRRRDGNPFALPRPVKRLITPGDWTTLAASGYGNNSWFQGATINHTPVAGEFTNDGLDDIAYFGRCGGDSHRCWRVHKNLGNGSFSTADFGGDIAFQGTNSYNRPTAGDFNGDGISDIAYYGLCGGDAHACWRVHLNNGAGAFAPGVDYGGGTRFASTGVTSTPVVGDFDDDGYDDIAYAGICGSDNHSCLRVHINNRSGRFVATDGGGELQFQGDDANNTPMVGDFDGDADDDIAYFGACPGNCWRVHLNDGNGRFTATSFGGNVRFRNNDVTSTPVAADLNGDGYTDIVYSGICGSDNHACLRTHLNNQQGAFIAGDQGQNNLVAFEGADANNTPFAGDFDGDGTSGIGYFGMCGSSICWRIHQLP